jgi:hypothetical protein
MKRRTRISFCFFERKLCYKPISALPDFTRVFEIECDASRIRI